jgi:hypothetical protein
MELFALQDCDPEEVELCSDICIIQKIESQGLLYLLECVERCSNTDDYKIVYQYVTSYINGNIDPSHVKQFLDFLVVSTDKHILLLEEYFSMFNNKTNLKLLEDIYETIKLHYVDNDGYNTRDIIINKLLTIRPIRKASIEFPLYQTGRTNENKGLFSWFYQKKWITLETIQKRIQVLDPIINDLILCPKLLNIIRSNLIINAPYTYSDLKHVEIKQCSYVGYLIFLLQLSLKIWNKYKLLNSDYQNFPREDFTFNDSDNVKSLSFVNVMLAFHICYLPIYKIHSVVENQKQILDEKVRTFPALFSPIAYNNLVESQKSMNLQFGTINDLVNTNTFNDNITNLIDDYVAQGVVVSNDLIDDINNTLLTLIKKHKIKNISNTTYELIINIVSGKYPSNHHIRFNSISVLYSLIENIGYQKYTSQILTSMIKYNNEVNYFTWTQIEEANVHYKNFLTNLTLLFANSINENIFGELKDDIKLLIYKIASQNNTQLETLRDLSKQILERPTAYISEHVKQSIKLIVGTLDKSMETILYVLQNKILPVSELPKELVIPIERLCIGMLKYLSNGKDPIYVTFYLQFAVSGAMKNALYIINELFEADDFKDLISYDSDSKTFYKDIIYRVNITEQVRIKLKHCLDSIEINTVEDLPEEFLDQLTYTPIKIPVMLPNTDLFFDKGIIMTHLYNKKTNPYTREVMTFKDFEDHNLKPEIIEKLEEYKKRYNEWKSK